jgi:hypothetical protein
MTSEQRKRFAAQQTALKKAIAYSIQYQNEQANKPAEPPVEPPNPDAEQPSPHGQRRSF